MIRIGSRESKLAMVQTELYIKEIRANNPHLDISMVTMKTTGDKILHKSLDKIGGKGLFIKELDAALLAKETDYSVHSLKDMPMEENRDLPILAYSKREDSRDVLVLRSNLKALPENPVIGTSSRRRTLQAMELISDGVFKNIRGNVLTRLEKLDAGEYDGLILAAAGLKRLGLESRIHRYYSIEEIIPAAGQGIMVLQGRVEERCEFLGDINHKDSMYEALAERAFVKKLGGGCSSPIAANAYIEGDHLYLRGLYYKEENGTYITGELSGRVEDGKLIGKKLAIMLKAKLSGGRVCLVGAGPGDLELITLKGMRMIEKAEVILYDALVSPGFLSMFPKNAELIYAGKRSGNHTIPQSEINNILLKKALDGKFVVRLKGGDPFVFGRGAEELEFLMEYGIPYELVPGVTSAIAAPAYGGIAVTKRNISSSLHIITGHGKNNQEPGIPYDTLVNLEGTFIFLMGIRALESICKGLLKAGMCPDMSAAIVENGTLSSQRVTRSNISQLVDIANSKHINAPAIIVVGKVCEQENALEWVARRPMNGKRILVTRPKSLSSAISVKLRDLGAEVIEFPVIETKAIESNSILKKALSRLFSGNEEYQWLVFTSPSGVAHFLDELRQGGRDIRKLAGIKLSALGSATERVLNQAGMYAECIPSVYSAEALGKALCKSIGTGEKALILRAKSGSEDLTQILDLEDKLYEDVPLYETRYEDQGSYIEQIRKLILEDGVDFAAFTSASTVKGFIKALKLEDYSSIKAICIGEQTAKEAKRYGMNCMISEEASIESMIKLLL